MFVFSASVVTTPKIYVWIYDHKTLGKDRELGSGEVDVRFFRLKVVDVYSYNTIFLGRSGDIFNRKERRLRRFLSSCDIVVF